MTNFCDEHDCNLGDGDCDRDSDCSGDLICGINNFLDFHPTVNAGKNTQDVCIEGKIFFFCFVSFINECQLHIHNPPNFHKF